MRTEQDLRDACRAVADLAPTPEEAGLTVPPDDRRPPVRRRPLLLAGVAVCTVVAITIPTVLSVRDQPDISTDPPGPKSWLRRTVDVSLAGWRESDRLHTADGERVTLESTRPGGPLCGITAFAPGQFDRRAIPQDAASLTVQGRPAYFANMGGGTVSFSTVPPSAEPTAGPAPKSWTLAWQYDGASWASVVCWDAANAGPATRAHAERIAAAARFDGRPERLPFALGYLPSDRYQPFSISIRPPRVQDGRPDLFAELALAVPGGRGKSGEIWIRLGAASGSPTPPKGDTVDINGRRAWIAPDRTGLSYEGAGFSVSIWTPYQLTGDHRAELIRIARGLRVASNVMDAAGWYQGEDILPPR